MQLIPRSKYQYEGSPYVCFTGYGRLYGSSAIEREPDDDGRCEMVWVTVYSDGAATTMTANQSSNSPGGRSTSATEILAASSLAPAAKGAGINDEVAVSNKVALAPGVQKQAGAASSIRSSSTVFQSSPTSAVAPASTGGSSSPTPDSSSALNLPIRPDGSAPIPVNDHHLSAPIAKDPVPAGAATYTPPTAGVFNNTDFAAWMKQKDANIASKWMIVAAGAYRYASGPVMPSGTDPNTGRRRYRNPLHNRRLDARSARRDVLRRYYT